MEKAIAEKFINKKVFITLVSAMKYNGRILAVYEDGLLMRDRFNCDVFLSLDCISSLVEVSENGQ